MTIACVMTIKASTAGVLANALAMATISSLKLLMVAWTKTRMPFKDSRKKPLKLIDHDE